MMMLLVPHLKISTLATAVIVMKKLLTVTYLLTYERHFYAECSLAVRTQS